MGKEGLEHGSDPRFFAYYAEASLSDAAVQRFVNVQSKALALLRAPAHAVQELGVLDIGCGAGTQAILWAEKGHRVSALDVNEPLIELGRARVLERGLKVRFEVGTATALPFGDREFDVCLLPQLLEHVEDWRGCLAEAVRVLKPGGLLYLSTTNKLCPVQHEFNLPLYSWYPALLKRRYEHLARTKRPELANYATYPAVHWFTFYGLSAHLGQLGMRCMDRFDVVDDRSLAPLKRLALSTCRRVAPARFIGHVLSPAVSLFAIKQSEPRAG
jgi:2-polyprenyl-6-hydroxyphenyl methylase/3-demethylubiquinone-9 3-methyltransferase